MLHLPKAAPRVRPKGPSMQIRGPSALVFALALWAGVAVAAGADSPAPGVTPDNITFAQTACLSGVCGETGKRFRSGILAAFHQRNLQGGVDGRMLVLASHDDTYNPETAVAKAVEFATDAGVFAVIGGIGTPTAQRIAPILRNAGIPFVGVLSGARFLREHDHYPNVVNLRTGYAEEVHGLVSHLHDKLGARRFGIIYQDDALGRSVLSSLHVSLEEFDLPILAKASYTWHTHSVHGTLFVLEKADLDVVVLAATTSNSSEAIEFARAFGDDYIFGLLSIVNLDLLKEQLGPEFGPAVITRVFPDASDESIPLVKRFRAAMEVYRNDAAGPGPHVADESSLEGYVIGRFVIDVLERMQGETNREEFLKTALESGPFSLDGWEIAFESGSNAGSDYVRLVEITKDGQPEMEASR